MKTFTSTFLGALAVSLLTSVGWAQNFNNDGGAARQQQNLGRATNALPQAVGGANRQPDRFDRTPLDRRLGNLRQGVGGPNRRFEAPPQTNQPEDLAQQQGQDQQGTGGQQQGQDGGFGGLGGFVGGGGGMGPVATVQSARMHAAAEVVRSAGEYNRNTGAAQVYHQKAREQAIDNNYSSVINYFKIRSANRELRNAERGPVPTQEDVYRYSQSRVPERLSDAQLNRQIGDIQWPALLMRPEFASHRARLAELFYNRTYYNSGMASPSYTEIKAETERMMSTLEDLVYESDPTSYLGAKKFITGLAYEARFVATADGLASS